MSETPSHSRVYRVEQQRFKDTAKWIVAFVAPIIIGVIALFWQFSENVENARANAVQECNDRVEGDRSFLRFILRTHGIDDELMDFEEVE